MSLPRAPAGGSYTIVTETCVPRPLLVSRNSMRPLLGTLAPSTDFHAITSPGRSSMSTESHSTVVPAGAFTFQCDFLESST
jgi:hypothetical protein